MVEIYKVRDFIDQVKNAQLMIFGINMEYIENVKNGVQMAEIMKLTPKVIVEYFEGIHSYFSSWYEQIIEQTCRAYDWDYRAYLRDVIKNIDDNMKRHFMNLFDECTEEVYNTVFLPDLNRIINQIKSKEI